METKMTNDLKVIRDIEKRIGKTLEERPLAKITWNTRGYAVEKGRVTGLGLWDCKLDDLSPLEPLTQLRQLVVSNNQLTDLSPLESLTQLLRVFNNQLTDLSPLEPLTQLRELYVSYNQLTDLSPLEPLTQLRKLDVSYNQLTDLSPLEPLTQLRELRVFNNQLTDLSPLQSLKQLRHLDLSNNKITHLPPFITQWDMEIKWESGFSGYGIYLTNNPLESPPPEIVKQGKEAVRSYFIELQKNSTLLLQCKLLFVGSGEVGKTTLMRTLTEPRFQLKKEDIGNEESTHGIHIKPWKITCPLEKDTQPSRQITLHTWDFGGQDIYLSTHQFFLTKRSLYIFVWEARKEEEQSGSFDYWLNIVKLLSQNSPVMVVMNKADVRIKHIDRAVFAKKFNNIVDFFQVSCLDRRGMAELETTIHRVLGRMPHLKDRLPKSWQEIRQKLQKEQKNHIDANRYYQICKPYNLEKGREGADHLSDYLHDLGAILRFRKDPVLKNTLILNPEWATQAVYKLVDTPEIIQNKGRFDFHDLEKIWAPNRYPPEKHHQLIRLMEKFELCFNFTASTTYIVPELVPNECPGIETDYDGEADTLRFQYRYDFMPKGIVSRFIARNYYLIKEECFWKNGVELRFEDASALVTADPLAKTLKIWAHGNQKRDLMAIIRNELNHIHDTLNMKKEEDYYQEEIPCNCSHCLKAEKPHLFTFDDLKRFAAKGRSPYCMKSTEPVSPDKLLQGYEVPKPKGEETFFDALLLAASGLQGIGLKVHGNENGRTDLIAQLLTMRYYIVHKQTRWGRSEKGKDLGELDLKIDTPDGRTGTIVEAFNLSGLHLTVISRHLKKIFHYDANGLPENFILVYADVDESKFDDLWQNYFNYIGQKEKKKVNYPFPMQGPVKEVETGMADIKCARTTHSRHNKKTDLVHLFVKMA